MQSSWAGWVWGLGEWVAGALTSFLTVLVKSPERLGTLETSSAPALRALASAE